MNLIQIFSTEDDSAHAHMSVHERELYSPIHQYGPNEYPVGLVISSPVLTETDTSLL